MPTFSSTAEMKAYILNRSKTAVFNAREKVYHIINECLRVYYGEFEPEEYIRTMQLFYSLVRTDVKSTGNGWEAEVYFDASQLNYENGAMMLKHTPEHGRYGWATWGAEEVLDTAMHGSHGGYVDGTAIWDDSMGKLGNIIALIKQKLIEAGIPVR